MKNVNSRSLQAAVMRISAVSISGNILLALIKAAAGLAAGSGALLSDAVHSAADLFSSVIVIAGVRMSAKAPDHEHPYGHERFECVAAIVLAVVLLVTGVFIGVEAVGKLRSGGAADAPGMLAIVVAALSIVIKEALFRYTWFHAQRHDSSSLRADAWHHRSDALGTMGVLVGVAGARMGFPMLDSVASLMICGFIIRAAYRIFCDAIRKMVDHACCAELETALMCCVQRQPDVLTVEQLLTREFGSRIYADVEIQVDGRLSLAEGCGIAQRVHDAVETQFPQIKHITISAKPCEAQRQ